MRHPEGFSDDLLECIKSGLALWRADLESRLMHWQHAGTDFPCPSYEWYAVELSADRNCVTVPVGGEGTYGSYHMFEELFPDMLYRYLPLWFLVDMELGRRDASGWFPEVLWTPLYAPEKREAARQVFRRPKNA